MPVPFTARLQPERRAFWAVVLILCAIAAAVSIRRLAALAEPSAGSSPMAALDAVFAAKAALTGAHALVGLALALAIPIQLSWRVRRRRPALHRWLGRVLLLAGISVGVTGIALLVRPVGGPLEVAAIVVYGAWLLACLAIAWRRIRERDVARHREWMLRAMAVLLGIATTRPVVGAFFATTGWTGLSPGSSSAPRSGSGSPRPCLRANGTSVGRERPNRVSPYNEADAAARQDAIVAEHTKQPDVVSGRMSGSTTVTCEQCGAVLDVLCLAYGGDVSTAPYVVRCPAPGCAALLHVELASAPIAVVPHHGP